MEEAVLLVLVICVVTNQCIHATICDVMTATRLIVALRNYLSCDSVTLLRSGGENKQQDNFLVEMMKYLAESNVLTTNLQFRQDAMSSYSALHVLTTSSHETKDYISLIPWRKPRASKWLLFLDKADTLEDVIGEVFLPLHCQFIVAIFTETSGGFILIEVYRTAPGRPLHRLQFGSWSPDHGLKVTSKDFFRRRNLHGEIIKGGTIFGSSISSLKNNKDSLNGFDGQAWSLLEEILNFRTEVVVTPQQFGGSRLDNGTWSGLVGLLQRREIQVTVNLILMSSLRSKAVDFSVPMLQVHDDIFVRHALHNAVDWGSYLAPFSMKLWIALLATVCTITLTLYTASKFCLKNSSSSSSTPSWYDLLFYVQGAFFLQGQASLSSSNPCRIACITCYLTAIIFFGAYSAFIISSLTLRTPELPFTSLEGLLQSKTHQFGIRVPSGEFFLFREASEGVLKEVYVQLLLPQLQDQPTSDLEGLKRICERHNYAYFTTTEYILVHLNHLACPVTTIPRHVFVFYIALGFPKNSPYTGLFNYAIQRTQEAGLLRRLKDHALTHFPRKIPEAYVPVEMRNVVPVFTLLCFGFVLSLVVLVLEVNSASYKVVPNNIP